MPNQWTAQPVYTPDSVEKYWDVINQISVYISENNTQPAATLLKSANFIESNDPAVLEQAGILSIHLQLWDEAVDIFNKINVPAKSVKYIKTYARNMQSLYKHRPLVYQKILAGNVSLKCDIITTTSGSATITYIDKNGKSQLLSPVQEPAEQSLQSWELMKNDCLIQKKCFALCGIGDGYILDVMAKQYSQNSTLERMQCVHICEIYPEIIAQAFMIHDYSGANGPIEHNRFEWWVGSDWDKQLLSAICNQPYIPAPAQMLSTCVYSDKIADKINKLNSGLSRHFDKLRDDVFRKYADKSAEDYLNILDDNPPRQPRALLITSRFTTVLQHSIRDIAAALQDMGWQTEIIIETAEHYINSPFAIVQTLFDFEPDIIIHIDHLRSERKNIIPDSIPYLCWIQDDLIHLTNQQAGKSVSMRDYILTCSQPSYTANYDYPARQCIYLNKLTRPVKSQVIHSRAKSDLVYVSNSSHQAALLINNFCNEYKNDLTVQKFIKACCARMQNVYANNHALYNLNDIRNIVMDESDRFGINWPQTQNREQFIIRLAGALNNALYRQQALDWVIDVACQLDLKLELYGKGWEEHPKYSRFACGYVQYGQPLEQLTQQARFNLQIVPYSCMHQRLLDGIAAGGFFLIREHPIDKHARLIDDFMSEHINKCILNRTDAKKHFSADIWEKFKQIDDYNCKITEHAGADLIEAWNQYNNQGIRAVLKGLPYLSEVSFTDADSLKTLINGFIDNPDLQDKIQREQYKFVVDNFSYRKGFDRILKSVRQLIGSE